MEPLNTPGTLYLVATPIGNLEDITARALRILSEVDLIAAEDTRQTLKLLNHFDIKKSLVSYYEHNKITKGNYLIERLLAGDNIALVSDAGTPGISDPGEDLVRLCVEHGITVTMCPGPVASIMGLVISGLPTGRFVFEGFLPMNKKSRRAHLESLKREERTILFHEAPHKLPYTLQDLLDTFGDRQIALARELTKKHEEVLRGPISYFIDLYAQQPPRGEYVIVMDGAKPEELATLEEDENTIASLSIVEHVNMLIAGGLSKKDAIKEAAVQRGVSKRDVYNTYEAESTN